MASRVFDTYLEYEGEDLSQFVNSISNGRILVFALKVCYFRTVATLRHCLLVLRSLAEKWSGH